jgi:acyl-CoA thioesterase-1
MSWLACRFLLIGLFVAFSTIAHADDLPACDMPTDLTTPSDPLAHAASALSKKGSLDILALGSGSTVGEAGGAGGPAMVSAKPGRSFPYRMVDTLKLMRPTAHFQLTVKGGRSLTADDMLPLLREALASHQYDLVLWQTGTVEAVHGSRPEALRSVLQDGADATEEAHADLVLIDPQFSRFLRANADLSPYETVLEQMTGNPGVTLFHRFDLTQTWVGNGQIDLERVDRDQRDRTIMQLNNCLGQALGHYIMAGIAEH